MSVRVTAAILRDLSPADAAALWMVQRDSGTPVEAGLFEAWLEEPDNAGAWERLENAWSVFDAVEDAELDALRASALAAGPDRRDHRHWRAFTAAAAMIAMVGGGALLLSRGGKPPVGPNTGPMTVVTASMIKTVTLAEGSRMTLDVDSSARIPAGGRRVQLDRGRAVFAVRHDTARPFSVVAGARTIVDLGTRFEVEIAASAVRVAVFEGRVRVDGGADGGTQLRPGQTLVASDGQQDDVSTTRADSEALWQQGLAEFNNATLADAAEQISAGSEVKLVILDPRVAGLRVSGRFRLRDPLRFANTVAEILPVRVLKVDRARIELRYRR